MPIIPETSISLSSNPAKIFEPPQVVILSHQRSGTHFLESSLEVHPNITTRGEFILRYQRMQRAGVAHPERERFEDNPYRFRNRPDHVNVGIVMYNQLAHFEQFCGPLTKCKVLHLIRNPLQIALSLRQMEVDRQLMGNKFRAHYDTTDEIQLPGIAPDAVGLDEQVARIAAWQAEHVALLAGHPDNLAITYEEMTQDQQVNRMADDVAAKLLDFLQLAYHLLETRLVKTSLRGTGVNKLRTTA
jgi:hypothetical protein